ncbi:hypothetical protein FFI97_009475 [Variovorax sp. KBS0712]|uniref:hypothetical protein n=1 Tax=Variovorax sp. KBS0712 TaxID=2578111 RepID=UPI001117F3C6|nr:hypothetical protein [Variovorax sp. KBS0712]TSD60485.1 hypothetical protein FFI97_009475 [Variovorax sp. KBS0712]
MAASARVIEFKAGIGIFEVEVGKCCVAAVRVWPLQTADSTGRCAVALERCDHVQIDPISHFEAGF